MKQDIPKRHEQKMYLFLTYAFEDGSRYSLKHFQSSGMDDDICLTPDGITVYCDIPELTDTEITLQAIKGLEDKQKDVLAIAEVRSNALQERIDSLKAITYEPDDAA